MSSPSEPTAAPLAWRPDAPATAFLLGRGQIEQVNANPGHALAILGLRAKGGDGGHRVLGELMQAQLPEAKSLLREFDWMRQKRNDTEYHEEDRPTATVEDVSDAIPAAERIVELAARFLDEVEAGRP